MLKENHIEPLYLDNASTTSIDDRVFEAMKPYFQKYYGNPSASNQHAIKPKEAIEQAREFLADLINASKDKVIFNSGSTEGINHIIKSRFFSSISEGKNHLVISAIEHKAVHEVADYLETIGCEVTRLCVDKKGLVNLTELSQSLTEKTFLVCVMLVNNETGVIQPIEKVVAISQEKSIPVFTDATQAIGKMSVDVNELDVDYLCLSAHKIYGPKGVGAIYAKDISSLQPLIHGGSQERSLRGGTYNVPGIVGLGKASELASSELASRISFYKKKKKKILAEVIGSDGVENFQESPKVDNIISVTLNEEENEEYLSKQRNKFSASTGSACFAEIVQDSHVLKAIPGIEPKKVIRISI
jgi:cysteine desulfurase